MDIEDLGYVEEMRQRLGLEPNDFSRDGDILSMSPMRRVALIAGWYHGDEGWAEIWKNYFESQGIYLTTNPNTEGRIED